MLRSNVGVAVRRLRFHLGLRQADVAHRVGLSREAVSRLERGGVREVSVGTIERVAASLGASVDLNLRWRGEELDRLVDAGHAALQQDVARLLASAGWSVRPEVSFNHFGDRGRVDVLAFQPRVGALLVVEVKTGIGDLQDTLGRIDVKVRLGHSLAESVGFLPVARIAPALVALDSRTTRATVASHDALFHRFDLRGRAAVAWVRRPVGPIPTGLLWFAKLPDSHRATVMRRRRVRRRREHA